MSPAPPVARPQAGVIAISLNRWQPKIRRTHAMIELAVGEGRRACFIEHPRHLKALRRPDTRREWLDHLRPRPAALVDGNVRVRVTSTLVPAHRGGLAAMTDDWRLRRALRQEQDVGASVVVATAPWHWPGTDGVPALRRVFDCGEDWVSVLPRRSRAMRRLYARIGREADAIIVVNPELERWFPGEKTVLVPNGLGADVLAPPLTARPPERRLVYVGTLCPRFDAPLVDATLRALPGWRLDIFGDCAYPRHGTSPGKDFQQLLERHAGVVTWHGPVDRADLSTVLDAGRTLIVPHRRGPSAGQDSQKLYEYAARGRPIVSTTWSPHLKIAAPPRTALADDPAAFAAAVTAAERDRPDHRAEGRRWAEANSWDSRWAAWSRALFG